MLSVVVFPLHVGSSARFSTAGLDMGTQVLLDPVGSLALLLGLVVAPPAVEELTDGQVTQLDLRPATITVKIHSHLKIIFSLSLSHYQ